MDTATFGFLIGFTTSRPLRPDEHFTFITIASEDSDRGRREAEWTAIAMASGIHRASMITSSELLHAEL